MALLWSPWHLVASRLNQFQCLMPARTNDNTWAQQFHWNLIQNCKLIMSAPFTVCQLNFFLQIGFKRKKKKEKQLVHMNQKSTPYTMSKNVPWFWHLILWYLIGSWIGHAQHTMGWLVTESLLSATHQSWKVGCYWELWLLSSGTTVQ